MALEALKSGAQTALLAPVDHCKEFSPQQPSASGSPALPLLSRYLE